MNQQLGRDLDEIQKLFLVYRQKSRHFRFGDFLYEAKMKQSLAVISLIIAGLVAINELDWLGKSDLAWPLMGIAIAIGLLAISQLVKGDEE